MEARITQCPRCGTSFRVTDALLAIAAGAVRCGSCLHIFNARENWQDEKAAEKPVEPSPQPSNVRNIADNNPGNNAARREPVIDEDALFDDDSPLFDDDDEGTAHEADSGRAIFNPGDADFIPEKTTDESLFGEFMDESDWLTPNSVTFEGDANEDESADDSWAEDLLRDDAPKASVIEADDSVEPFEFVQAISTGERVSIIDDYQLAHDDILAQAPASDESQADDLADEFLDIPTASDPGLRRDVADDATADDRDTDQPGDDGEPGPADNAESGFSAGERIGDESPLAALHGLSTEPIRMHQFVRESRWPKFLWGAGFVIAAAALPAQYLYFNFASLARGELRPWLAQACAIVGCRLPAQSDPARIRTGSLIVRSHPGERGALAVDAIITNLATFAQPYPELVLQFTDLNGAPVAGRRFKPAEYLGGELTGSRLMPVGQPVHIGLEVRDPGPRAVNYLLAVSPAQY
jgi:predicted Zn finger-like uncharacterized protein